jgi:hypothetical protein
MINLFDAAVDGAVEGERGQPADRDLLRRIPSGSERARIEGSVTYGGCNEVRALGKAPLRAGEPGYRETMDGDGDGIACEPIR